MIRILFFLSLFFISIGCRTHAPGGKGNSQAKNEQVKEQQKEAYLKAEKKFTEKHLKRQSKETRKRMKRNLKETNASYNSTRKPLLQRIFPRRYKH